MTDVGFFTTAGAFVKKVTPSFLDELGKKNAQVVFATVFPDWKENAKYNARNFKNGEWTFRNTKMTSKEVINFITDCMKSDTWMEGVSVSSYTPQTNKGIKTAVYGGNPFLEEKFDELNAKGRRFRESVDKLKNSPKFRKATNDLIDEVADALKLKGQKTKIKAQKTKRGKKSPYELRVRDMF